MKKIIISHFTHKGKECIRLDFSYDVQIIKILKKLETAKWSMQNRCWYIVDENDNLENAKSKLGEYATIKYLPLGETFELDTNNKKSKSSFDPFSDYSSLFISYSFKDKEFVKKVNNVLLQKGVETFLWEKDAPFGKTLEDIMFENVHKYDRILFVASENSIKSEACQYELSQARKKQDKLWETIIFPIHIDNFLFEVRKETIRPRHKSDEYWANIIELRSINSFDFTNLVGDFNEEKLELQIDRLLQDLKN